jgi:hypothetical protein
VCTAAGERCLNRRGIASGGLGLDTAEAFKPEINPGAPTSRAAVRQGARVRPASERLGKNCKPNGMRRATYDRLREKMLIARKCVIRHCGNESEVDPKFALTRSAKPALPLAFGRIA